MSALDTQLEEAARLDGARFWRILWAVYVPNLRRVMELVLVINTITAFAYMLTYVYVITNGGPGYSTYSIEFYIYNVGFTGQELGYAAALSVVLTLIIAVVGFFQIRMHAICKGWGWQGVNSFFHSQIPRRHRTPGRVLQFFALCLIAVAAVFPLYFMVSGAFRSQDAWNNSRIGFPTTISLDAFHGAWRSAQLGDYLKNSAIVTVASVLISVVVASFAGYSFSKLEWRGGRAAYLFVLAFLAVAPVALIVPVYIQMSQLNLVDNYWSVILFYVALNTPFNTYLMSTFFRALPDELVEAARMDGAQVHSTFFRVLLPLAKPALATVCIFNFLFVWNEFIFALLLLQSDSVKTSTVGVLGLQGRFTINDPMIMAGLVLTSLPVIGIYLFFQKYLVRGIVTGAVK
jgi:ABC-type glycerol-3-phosphate transport system permease component